jgi:aspartate-semialdehyde dehydrogenase
MSRLSAKAHGTARIAVLGSSSERGASLRQALCDFGLPGSRVDLYATTDEAEPVISEYDGEARLIQKPDLDELAGRNVVFVCEPGEIVDAVFRRASAELRVIDLAHARRESTRARLVHVDVDPSAARDAPPVLALPHELSTLLVDLIHPLTRAFGCAAAVALILRPAADFGERGVEELREQTVGLLSFTPPAAPVFGRQLAFNVLPQSVLPDAAEGLERRVAEEARIVLGLPEPRLSVCLAAAPVFHGHSVGLCFRPERAVEAPEVRAALEAARIPVAGGAGARITPVDVSTSRGTYVADVSPDGLGGHWIWAVVAEAAARNAELAVRLAGAVVDL